MQISLTVIKACLLAAGKKDIRCYLNGLHVTATHIVGCDGHMLVAVEHKQVVPGWVDVTVPRDRVELAIKAAGKNANLDLTADSIGGIPYSPIDGNYPDWNRVIPATIPEFQGIAVQVNPELFAAAAKAASLLGSGSWPEFYHFDGKIVAKPTDAIVLVMGFRDSIPRQPVAEAAEAT